MRRAANVPENPIKTRQQMANMRLHAVEAIMDSKGIIETLRERLAELENLEVSGASTPDTHEEVVDIHEFLGRLYTISLKHTSKTTH
jgi:hypothetical protein